MTNKAQLEGMIFNRLTVLADVGKRSKKGAILWLCLCECGTTTFVQTNHLKKNRVKSCGCLNDELKRKRYKDLSNYENTNFKVLEKIGSFNQRVDWLCLCKHCGNTTILNSNEITKTKSCGCLKGASKEFMASITDHESLKSTKPTKKSTTGVRGVYYNKKRDNYQAFINVDKKTKFLGSSKSFSKAVALRKSAEQEFWGKQE